jgi:hypothetical protein
MLEKKLLDDYQHEKLDLVDQYTQHRKEYSKIIGILSISNVVLGFCLACQQKQHAISEELFSTVLPLFLIGIPLWAMILSLSKLFGSKDTIQEKQKTLQVNFRIALGINLLFSLAIIIRMIRLLIAPSS